MIENVTMGTGVHIPFPDLCNLYDCSLGDYAFVGPFVEIQRNVTVGRYSKIESHSFICSGVTIGDEVFVGHGVMFTNDRYPYVNNGPPRLEKTIVHNGVAIGSGAVILPGVTVGERAIIGAGAVVTRNVPGYTIVAGNPAKVLRNLL